MTTILIVSLLGIFAIFWLATVPFRARLRRAKLAKQPFAHQWRSIIKHNVPYFQILPVDLQLQLKKHMKVFLAEKQFIGCQNLQITDEIRITIAAQACLLLLNRHTDYYPKLRQILVYPAAFIVEKEQQNELGLHFQHKAVLLGESWEEGQVILSWQDTLAGAADPYDGSNVVIHEFAHQLDQEDGSANGAPLLEARTDYSHWSKILGQEYLQLVQCAEQGLPSLFSYYGATNPAEFFAVISEVFFEQPIEFKTHHPALYQQLSLYYCLDPALWFSET